MRGQAKTDTTPPSPKSIKLLLIASVVLLLGSRSVPLSRIYRHQPRFSIAAMPPLSGLLLRSNVSDGLLLSGERATGLELTAKGALCAVEGTCWLAADRMRRCRGDAVLSQSFLTLQPDGNLCAYEGSGPADNRGVLWCNGSLQRCASGTAQLSFIEPEGRLVGSCAGASEPPTFSVPLKSEDLSLIHI